VRGQAHKAEAQPTHTCCATRSELAARGHEAKPKGGEGGASGKKNGHGVEV
jgi:hypothetical protein